MSRKFAVAAAALALALAGCTSGEDRPSTTTAVAPAPTTSVPTPAPVTSGVPTAQVGECAALAALGAQEVEKFPATPCTDPHDIEVVAVLLMDGTDWPGDAEVTAKAGELCRPEFTAYVGTDPAASTLALRFLAPSQQGWTEAGDREVLCLAVSPEPRTGSVAGTNS